MTHIERVIDKSLITRVKTNVRHILLRANTHLHCNITWITNRVELLCPLIFQSTPSYTNLDTSIAT